VSKTCWNCGHWLIGLGCTREDVNNCIPTEHDHTCNEWVKEGTQGTVTDYGYDDGKNEEWLKDDMSNL